MTPGPNNRKAATIFWIVATLLFLAAFHYGMTKDREALCAIDDLLEC